jgi:hypothetical protein
MSESDVRKDGLERDGEAADIRYRGGAVAAAAVLA